MPYRITEIEVTEPLPSIAVPEGDTGIAILLRRNGRPIAFLMEAFPGKSVLSPEDLERIIRQGVTSRLLEEDPPEENVIILPAGAVPIPYGGHLHQGSPIGS